MGGSIAAAARTEAGAETPLARLVAQAECLDVAALSLMAARPQADPDALASNAACFSLIF